MQGILLPPSMFLSHDPCDLHCFFRISLECDVICTLLPTSSELSYREPYSILHICHIVSFRCWCCDRRYVFTCVSFHLLVIGVTSRAVI